MGGLIGILPNSPPPLATARKSLLVHHHILATLKATEQGCTALPVKQVRLRKQLASRMPGLDSSSLSAAVRSTYLSPAAALVVAASLLLLEEGAWQPCL